MTETITLAPPEEDAYIAPSKPTAADASPNAWFNMLGRKGVLVSPVVLDAWLPDGPLGIADYLRDRVQRAYLKFTQDPTALRDWLKVVFEDLLGHKQLGVWQRGNDVDTKYKSELGKPDWVLHSAAKTQYPRFLVFIEDELATAGKKEDTDGWVPGRLLGKRAKDHYARALRIMAAANTPLAIMTNGHEFRLIYNGLDHDTYAEWRAEDWFSGTEGRLTLHGFVTLLGIRTLPCDPDTADRHALLERIQESRDKQGDLSFVMGTQVREAVELILEDFNISLKSLPLARQQAVKAAMANLGMDERAQLRALYQGAIRIVMRLVVTLYAEARSLLPREQEDYFDSYSVDGLYTTLRAAALDNQFEAMQNSRSAWLRLQSLFAAIYTGTHHDRLDIPGYGGQLFEPAQPGSKDHALAALQCLGHPDVRITDETVYHVLRKLKVGQFRVGGTWRTGPVDFSDLRTEFIGMMYEGLLDYDLRVAREEDDGIIFLNVGDQPALPFKVLATMSDKQIKELVKESKQKAKRSVNLEEEGVEFTVEAEGTADTWDARVHAWAVKAVQLVYPDVSASALKKEKSVTERNAKLNEAARRLILKKVDKGGYYLVAWSGTRKGSGTFYTKPGLAVPTARRTIEPKVYTRKGDRLIPKTPAEILAVKVCDPAMGSGAFPVAALRYMAKVLSESIEYHVLKKSENGSEFTWDPKRRIGELCAEVIEVSKKDENWRDRLDAKVKRLVAEHCIYGVDLNPLAVELGKLALWIETMDKGLRFTFLDHRIKHGNSLVGAWLHQVEHYPIAAWARKAGTGSESDPRKPLIAAIRSQVIGPEFREYLESLQFTNGRWVVSRQAGLFGVATPAPATYSGALADARQALEELHAIHDERERENAYRERIENDTRLKALKYQLDKWISIWFWPIVDAAGSQPPLLGPKEFYQAEQSPGVRAVVENVVDQNRFLHWELEFPEVFNDARFGFDVMLGNPPWDIAKPNSLEFFTRYDPAYRQLGKQRAIARQKELFADMGIGATILREWLDYNEGIKSLSNYVKYAHQPHLVKQLGNVQKVRTRWLQVTGTTEWQAKFDKAEAERKAQVAAKANASLGDEEEEDVIDVGPLLVSKRPGFVTPYYYQGKGDLNLYKLFLERFHAGLQSGGRLGVITPAGIYADNGTRPLRELFLDKCQWEWIYGFQNGKKIFDIHAQFKFCASVIEKVPPREAVKTQFMVRDLAPWASASPPYLPYNNALTERLSPYNRSLLEPQSPADLELAAKIFGKARPLAECGYRYVAEFHMTNDSGLFKSVAHWLERGYAPTESGAWKNGHGEVALPLYNGTMVYILDPIYKAFEGGTKWRFLPHDQKEFRPKYLMDQATYEANRRGARAAFKIGFRDITNATNTRTFIIAAVPDFPCANALPVLEASAPNTSDVQRLAHLGVLASYATDFFMRLKVNGTHLNWFVAREAPVPRLTPHLETAMAEIVRSLNLHPDFFSMSERGFSWLDSPIERAMALERLDELAAEAFGLSSDDMRYILRPDNPDARSLWKDYQRRLEILEAAGRAGRWWSLAEARPVRESAGLPWTAAASDEEDEEEETDLE